jgi:hypothetical protein
VLFEKRLQISPLTRPARAQEKTLRKAVSDDTVLPFAALQ